MPTENNADYLMTAAMNAGIRDPKELANFMGQMQVESGGFKSMDENLHYSGDRLLEVFPGRNGLHDVKQADQIVAGGPESVANAIYGGAWGKRNLGNTEPGDGWTFHGRGYVQLTGRDNYAQVGKELGLDLVHHPELAADRDIAAKIAIHYWQDRVVANHDQLDVTGACHDINGGEKGLPERKAAAQAWEHKLEHGYVPGAPNNPTHTEALKLGDRGDDVHQLQSELAKLGYTGVNGHPIKPDGDFGRDTQHALETFQRDHHLTVDGKAGPQTLDALHQQGQSKGAPAPTSLEDPKNPDHGLYQQALDGVHKIDAQLGRASDQQSANLAAALVVVAKQEGLKQIDDVRLSNDGSHAFAVQGQAQSPEKQYASVETAQAVQTSVAQSSVSAASVPTPNEVPASSLSQDPQLNTAQAPTL
jgi:putative chitinase